MAIGLPGGRGPNRATEFVPHRAAGETPVNPALSSIVEPFSDPASYGLWVNAPSAPTAPSVVAFDARGIVLTSTTISGSARKRVGTIRSQPSGEIFDLRNSSLSWRWRPDVAVAGNYQDLEFGTSANIAVAIDAGLFVLAPVIKLIGSVTVSDTFDPSLDLWFKIACDEVGNLTLYTSSDPVAIGWRERLALTSAQHTLPNVKAATVTVEALQNSQTINATMVSAFDSFNVFEQAVDPGFGALTLVGFAPTLQLPVSVSPGAGSVFVDGFAVTIQQPTVVTPGVGLLVLSGFAPTEQLPVSIALGFGALSVSGFAPTIQTPDTVTPGVGALTVAGFNPTLQRPVTIGPALGSLSLSGFAIAIQIPVTLSPGLGQLAIAGFSPVLQLPETVAPGAGSLVVSGFAPTIDLPVSSAVTVAPDVGDLVVTGYAPTVVIVAAPIIHFGGGGPAPRGRRRRSAETPETIEPGTGALEFRGFAPTIELGAAVAIDLQTSARIAEGFAPTIDLPTSVPVPASSGSGRKKNRPALPPPVIKPAPADKTPAVVQSPVFVHPGAGELALQGYAPSIELPFTITDWSAEQDDDDLEDILLLLASR